MSDRLKDLYEGLKDIYEDLRKIKIGE